MAIDNELIEKLATYICHSKIQPRKCNGVKIAGFDLHHDGRIVKTIVRELREGGYITDKEEKGHTTVYYFLTDLAWTKIEATKPDLMRWFLQDMKDVRFGKHQPYIRWSRLSLSEQKYIIIHAMSGKYAFAYGGIWGSVVEIYPFVPNSVDDLSEFKFGGNYDVMVSDPELANQVKVWRREQEIDRAFRHQFFEGLVHCGIIEKDVPKFMSVGDEASHLDGKTFFSADPSKWGIEVGERIQDVLSQLQKLHTLLGHLLKVQGGIVRYGGWDKFLTDYKQAVVEAVLRNEEVKSLVKEVPP